MEILVYGYAIGIGKTSLTTNRPHFLSLRIVSNCFNTCWIIINILLTASRTTFLFSQQSVINITLLQCQDLRHFCAIINVINKIHKLCEISFLMLLKSRQNHYQLSC